MDGLRNVRRRVTDEGWLTEAELDAVDTEVRGLSGDAVEQSKAAPPPDVSEVRTDVYVTY